DHVKAEDGRREAEEGGLRPLSVFRPRLRRECRGRGSAGLETHVLPGIPMRGPLTTARRLPWKESWMAVVTVLEILTGSRGRAGRACAGRLALAAATVVGLMMMPGVRPRGVMAHAAGKTLATYRNPVFARDFP